MRAAELAGRQGDRGRSLFTFRDGLLFAVAAIGDTEMLTRALGPRRRLGDSRAGRRLQSAALVADGNHARVDAFVSLGVVASALVVGLGVEIADPLIGLAITLVILKITWDSWRTVRHAPAG